MVGALEGVRVIEMGGPPGAFGTMLLADHGADVVRVARPATGASVGASTGLTEGMAMDRGKRAVGIDLEHPEGADAVLALVERADVFVEGFRPGVAERLGIGPDVCLERNPKLVYVRMTGWGQTGPLALVAGHDINYTALSGALNAVGIAGGPPVVPINYLGDWAGGMLLAFGVMVALHHSRATGEGQVVDTSMLDSASLMSSVFHSAIAQGSWRDERGVNMTDGGTPYYAVYETSDGRYVSIGALEPQFYKELIARLGIGPQSLPRQYDQSRWPEIRAALAGVFATKPRDEWVALLEGTDVCFAPVLSFIEATQHRHNVERGGFIENGGVVQPSPAPRMNRTPADVRPWSYSTATPREVLTSWGFHSDAVTRFVDSGVVRPTDLTTAKEQHVHSVQR